MIAATPEPASRPASACPLAVNAAQHKHEREEKNHQRDEFVQEFRDFRPLFFPEIAVPDVALDQRDDEERAEQDRDRAELAADVDRIVAVVEAQDFERQIGRKGDAEKLVHRAELHAGAPFQEPPESHGEPVNDRHRNREDQNFFRQQEGGDHWGVMLYNMKGCFKGE